MKKIFLPVIALLLFLTPAFASINSLPEIIIEPQPDSPLQLSHAVPRFEIFKDTDGKEWNMLTISLDKKNVSQKTIRVSAIWIDDDLTSTQFACPNDPRGLLRPNEQRKEGINQGSRDAQSSKIIKITVDFVEFTDGTTWGADIYESRQKLAGLRAGARAGQEYLQKIIGQKGIEFVMEAVDELKNISPPDNIQNERWKKGFNLGLRVLSNHIKDGYKKEGIKAIETELQKAQFLPT